jgi:hypothetical protein
VEIQVLACVRNTHVEIQVLACVRNTHVEIQVLACVRNTLVEIQVLACVRNYLYIVGRRLQCCLTLCKVFAEPYTFTYESDS